jgi:hypothetical protein
MPQVQTTLFDIVAHQTFDDEFVDKVCGEIDFTSGHANNGSRAILTIGNFA